MKTRTKTSILLMLIIVIAAAVALLCAQVNTNKVFADEVDAQPPAEYIVSNDTEYVDAEFEYIVINDTECSVRITNFDDVTRALIQEDAEIDGKMYAVTEIDDNGFMSSPNLIRVNLPDSIKRIGYSAFADCAKLNRINLANVQEIDDNAFEECPELSEILIPESAKKIGTHIFRGNNTQVRVRAEAAGDEWAASWNKKNDNQDVEYCSDYNHPIELETIYGTIARSANAIIGYSIASGQPRNEDFYVTITEDDWGDKTDSFKGSIFIPAEYNGKPIMKIADDAFYGVSFNQLIVEYAQEPLTIGSNAFARTKGDSIVINRDVCFHNDDKNIETNNIFKSSSVQSIVLPNNVTKLVDSMFAGCANLTNIFFIEPVNIDFEYTDLDNYLDESALDLNDEDYEKTVIRQRELCIIAKELNNLNGQVQKENQLMPENTLNSDNPGEGVVYIPGSSGVSAIGNNVFQGTNKILYLHLNDTIKDVGSTILSRWNNNKQTVYVHIDNSEDNTESCYGKWNPQWKSTFTNVKEIKTFYTITFELDEGSFVNIDEFVNSGEFVISDKGVVTKRVKRGKDIGYLPEVVKPRFNFVGWKSDGSSSVDEIYSDITLTAQWEPIKYTVTFERQGGEGGPGSATVSCVAELEGYEPPTRVGYDFRGYFDEPEGKGAQRFHHNMQVFSGWEIEDDMEVYAYWEPNKYTIILHSGYGKNEEIDKIEGQEYETVMQNLQKKPERPGYEFKGYYDQMNGAGKQYYDENMNVSKDEYGKDVVWDKALEENEVGHLYAHWELITYKITYELNGGENDSDNPKEYNIETMVKLKPATHDSLYFDGWSCNGIKVTTVGGHTGDIILTANWTDIKTISITEPFDNLFVDDPKVSIIMCCTFQSSCRIFFAANVVTAMISGFGNEYRMSIIISDRKTEFGLVLNHIDIIGTTYYPAISMQSKYTLYLSAVGLVNIKGRSPEDGTGDVAISCYELVICSLDNYEYKLTINGGNGSNGEQKGLNGTDGKNGGAAIKAENVIIACNHVIIEGGAGGDGGNAKLFAFGYKGYGGYGACAVSGGKAYITEKFSDVYVIKGIDGKDGDGQDSGGKPINPYDPGITTPIVPPVNPDFPITPPIGGWQPIPDPGIPPIVIL